MINKCLFAVALLSLALAVGCAKGGNGVPPVVPTVAVAPSGVADNQIYPTQTFTVTATTTDPQFAPVTWSLNGSGWTMISSAPPNAAAQVSATAIYQAPATVGSQATVTATLVSDTSITGPATLTVADIFTQVTPSTLSVGTGLAQQFTAVAVPNDAPQTFTWTCKPVRQFCSESKRAGSIRLHSE
jgi:hypothetical protein